MANQEILQTVQKVYKAFVQGDLPAVMDLTTHDVKFLPPPSAKIPWAPPWCGRKEGEQYLKTLVAALEFQDFGADEFIVGRNSVVVLGHERCRVRATGRAVEAKWAQIFDFREGLVCRHREYTDTTAWDAGF